MILVHDQATFLRNSEDVRAGQSEDLATFSQARMLREVLSASDHLALAVYSTSSLMASRHSASASGSRQPNHPYPSPLSSTSRLWG